MSGYRFGLEFAGKADVLANLGASAPIDLELDPAASIAAEAGEHVFIEGDNLAVLERLRCAYEGRVSLVYLDPPYNTGNDFVYRDRFAAGHAEELRRSGQVDAEGHALVANPQSSGRYHSAWLAMMMPRLWLCRRLLRPDGLLMCSIDDHEVHHLRCLLDEIFGEDCFIAQIVVVTNRGGRDYLRIATGHEYILVYGASPEAPVGELDRPARSSGLTDALGSFELRELRNRNPKFHPGNRPNLAYPIYVAPQPDPHGLCPVELEPRPGFDVVVTPQNSEGRGSVWRWGPAKVRQALAEPVAPLVARQRRDGGWNIYEKYRKTTRKPRALWDEPEFRTESGTAELRRLLGAAVFDHPKPVALLRRCLELGCPPGGLVVDPFAGSGTTMQAVLEQNAADDGGRRCVCIQVPAPCPANSAAAAAGWDTLTAIARARVHAAWRETPGRSLRWFRTRAPVEAFAVPAETDGEAYWQRLVAYEDALARVPLDPHAVGLTHGIPLDAELRVDGPWWVLVDANGEGALAGWGVDGRGPSEVGPEVWPDVPPQTTVVLPDDVFEDLAEAATQRGLRVAGRRAARL